MQKHSLLRTLLFVTLCCLLLPACRPGKLSSVLVYKNINGRTYVQGIDTLVTFSAMAIDSGRVIAIGENKELLDKYERAVVLDGSGKVLLPGLIDAHGHVMGLGQAALRVNLVGTTSLTDAMQRVKAFASEHPKSAWVVGRGWNQELWAEKRFPTAADIDKVVADRPVLLERVDGHAAVANTAALKAAGITAQTPDPKGGKIMHDAQGSPTGLLIDHAAALVERHIPQPTAEEQAQALSAAQDELVANGITAVHDAGIGADVWALYKSFADEKKLKLRIYCMIGGVGADFDSLSKNGPITDYADNRLTLRAVKLYADGALGSRGAALLQPYTDDPKNSGLLFDTPEALHAKMRKAAERGYQLCVHAIGDKANRVVLDGIELLNKSEQTSTAKLRHRIENAQIISPTDIPRFKRLNVIAGMQFTHATSDMNMAEARLGAARMPGAYAWQTLTTQGTVISGGSDFPVESCNPFLGLYAATTRQDITGQPPAGWYPQQRLSIPQALRAFTSSAAYAGFAEGQLGTLQPGARADFILIDGDVYGDPSTLKSNNVLETWVGGRLQYQKPRQ